MCFVSALADQFLSTQVHFFFSPHFFMRLMQGQFLARHAKSLSDMCCACVRACVRACLPACGVDDLTLSTLDDWPAVLPGFGRFQGESIPHDLSLR